MVDKAAARLRADLAEALALLDASDQDLVRKAVRAANRRLEDDESVVNLSVTSSPVGAAVEVRTTRRRLLVTARGTVYDEISLEDLDRLPPPPRLSDPLSFTVDSITVLGGSGFDLTVGDAITLEFGPAFVEVYARGSVAAQVAYTELVDLQLYGPGATTTNLGIIGGGFGWEGALRGIVAAEIINALTTRRSVETYLYLATGSGELFCRHDVHPPEVLRIRLSAVFVAMRSAGRAARGPNAGRR